MLPTIFSPDKFGFFQVGDFKTYSKLEALDIQTATGHWPHWNFNKEIFNKHNWFLEPPTDIDTLYQMRAKQIREAYDYCVIFFSGGADSTNILRSFVKAGCKIDEIATMTTENVNEARVNKDYDWGSELEIIVKPYIKSLQKQGLEFKFRQIYTPDLIIDYMNQVKEDYFYLINNCLSPNSPFKSILREKIDDYKHLIDSGKKVCFIHGIEKPYIKVDQNNNWFYNFNTQLDTCVSPYVQMNYHKGWYDELFYWTPDMPEIPIKQAHLTKKFCETVHDVRFYQKKATQHGYNKTLDMYLTLDSSRILLYPDNWNNTIYQASKSRHSAVRSGYGNLAFSERDGWLFRSQNDLAKRYETGLNNVIKKLKSNPHYNWFNDNSSAVTPIVQSIQEHQFA